MLDIVLDITFQQGQQEPTQASNHWDEINMISDVLRMYMTHSQMLGKVKYGLPAKI